MKIFTIYTPSIQILKDGFFLKTCPHDLEPDIRTFDTHEQYAWGRDTFREVIQWKVDLLVNLIHEHAGEIIVCADLDIQFLGPCAKRIRQCMVGKDICFQSELWPPCGKINAGFIAIRCNERSLAFFRKVQERQFVAENKFEQGVMQEILDKKPDLEWGTLPGEFWAYSHGRRPSRHVLLLHANCEGILEKKVEQLTAFGEYVRDLKRFCVIHGVLDRMRRSKWIRQCFLDHIPPRQRHRIRQLLRYEQPIQYRPSSFTPAIE